MGKLLAKAVEKDADRIIGTCRDITRAKRILESELDMEKIMLAECDFANENAYDVIRNAYDCAANELLHNIQELYILHCASESNRVFRNVFC